MTDSMVERVARALCGARFLNGGDPTDDGWDDLRQEMQEQCRLEARAAIEAMREPTQKMTDAVLLGDLDSWVIDDNWRAMIDAALANPPCRLHAETYGDLLPPVPK